MRIRASQIQVFVFVLFFHALSWGAAVSPQEESQMMASVWKLPSQFTLKRLELLLSRFSKEVYGKGFRFIGVEQDFFHGHVLFERIMQNGQNLLRPRAVLYHTQEEAHKAHWEKSVDPRFDYLNVTTRNWIQWLSDKSEEDGQRVENAREYLDVTQKDPLQFFNAEASPQIELHYTIHAKNLDNEKMGFELAGELQFEFYQDNNGSPYRDDRWISVSLGAEQINMRAFTNTVFIQRQASREH